MDGQKYLKLRKIIPQLNGVQIMWHADSEKAKITGDILGQTNVAFKNGDISYEQGQDIFEICAPQNIIH